MNNRPLRRIKEGAVLGGVAAGMADYFGIDKALMRLTFVILLMFTKGFPIVLVYIVLWAALPVAESGWASASITDWTTDDPTTRKREPSRGAELIGYVLLLIGGFLLLDRLFYWINFEKFIPAAICIGIGLFLIFRNSTKKEDNNDRATPSWTDSAPINDWQPPKDDSTKSE
ncbi:MAG: PspC domain-containing protein [Runella sp.]